MQRQIPHLLRSLQDWQQKQPGPDTPEQLGSLERPAIGKVTSSTVATFVRLASIRRSFSIYGIGSGGLAFLLGCSFDLFPSFGWGWYAPALTGLMLVYQRVPLWLYREPGTVKLPTIPRVEPVEESIKVRLD